MKIVIIGAGIGGLATAGLLAKEGHTVTVYEKNDQPGGRCGLLDTAGFRFDMGPSWYLMPDVFERFFTAMGTTADKELTLKPIDPQYRIFFDDKSSVDIQKDLQKNLDLFESIEPGSSKKFLEYLRQARVKYEFAIDKVLYKNMDSLLDFLSPELIRLGPQLGAIESMDSYVSRFFRSEKLKQILEYTLVFLGGSPKNTPALYSLMSHIDFNMNVYYPMGGMYEVVRALERLAKKAGATFEYSSPVQEILSDNGKVSGVVVNGKRIQADIVISNADYHFSDTILADQSARLYSEKTWDKKVLAPSAFLLYLGVKGKIPEFVHHNLYFGHNWMDHFDQIFDKPDWPKNPSLYVSMPSHMDPSVAPKGHENLMILVPIASKLSETEAQRKKYAKFIIQYVEEKMGVSLQDRIVHQTIFSVTDFTNRYNSQGGTALGLAHTLWQTAIFRPPNRNKKLQGLYYVGGNTVPGIGVPMCLISAQLVQDRLKKDLL